MRAKDLHESRSIAVFSPQGGIAVSQADGYLRHKVHVPAEVFSDTALLDRRRKSHWLAPIPGDIGRDAQCSNQQEGSATDCASTSFGQGYEKSRRSLT